MGREGVQGLPQGGRSRPSCVILGKSFPVLGLQEQEGMGWSDFQAHDSLS